MSTHKPFFCPSCHNQYSTLAECPECKTPLKHLQPPSSQQDVHGDQNQTISIGGNNKGPIIHAPTTVNRPDSEIAHYDVTQTGIYLSFWHIIKSRVYAGAGVAGVGLFSWLPGLASILDRLGYSANAIQLAESTASLFSFIFLLLIMSQIGRLYGIKEHKAYRIKGTIYENQEDGSIHVHQVSGKCPIVGCPGNLYLGVPEKNLEGIEFAATCTKYGGRHAFEFNDETLVGSRIKITPIPGEPKPFTAS